MYKDAHSLSEAVLPVYDVVAALGINNLKDDLIKLEFFQISQINWNSSRQNFKD